MEKEIQKIKDNFTSGECMSCGEKLTKEDVEFNGFGFSGMTCKKCGIGEVKITNP